MTGRTPGCQRHAGRGVALVSALLLVAVVAATAALVSQQTSQRLTRAQQRQDLAQAQASARGALDFGRWVLQQDALKDARQSVPLDTLAEPWAQSLPAFPVEGGQVTGGIRDAQGRINLNNAGLTHAASDVATLQRLLQQQGVDPTLAGAITDWVDTDDQPTVPGGAEDIDYLSLDPGRRAANRPMADVDELLRVRGFTPQAVAALRPFVTALPEHTAVNINTAPAEVLAALFGISGDEAVALVKVRSEAPFTGPEDLAARGTPGLKARLAAGTGTGTGTAVGTPGGTSATPVAATATTGPVPQFGQDWGVSSRYFQMDARATQGQVQYGLSALVRRDSAATYPVVLSQRRALY